MSFAQHQFEYHNRKISYLEAGLQHGRTILLLHGGIGDAKHNWLDIFPLLADEYHVLAPDLPGFGGSDPLANHARIEDLLLWLEDFLVSQDIDQAVVLGNSFGALLARLLATKYPQHIAAVILVNGGMIPQVPVGVKILALVPVIGMIVARNMAQKVTSAESIQTMIYHKEALTPDLLENAKLNTNGFARLMRMTAIHPFPVQNKPMVAMLIIWGIEDKSLPVSEGKKLKDLLSGSDFVEIAEVGHAPQLEEPDIFAWQVKKFLSKRDPVKKSTIPGT